MSPYCNPSVYRSFPNANIDGPDAAPPQLLRSERDCQRACCDIAGCQAYTFDRYTIMLGGSFAGCFFLTNGACSESVSQLDLYIQRAERVPVLCT